MTVDRMFNREVQCSKNDQRQNQLETDTMFDCWVWRCTKASQDTVK